MIYIYILFIILFNFYIYYLLNNKKNNFITSVIIIGFVLIQLLFLKNNYLPNSVFFLDTVFKSIIIVVSYYVIGYFKKEITRDLKRIEGGEILEKFWYFFFEVGMYIIFLMINFIQIKFLLDYVE